MRRRSAVLLLLCVMGLLLVGVGLSLRLLRAGVATASAATAERLMGIGLTAARALSLGAGEGLLPSLCHDSQLEDAYLLDRSLHPLRQGTLSLLRIDPDRALAALSGRPSVGPAYSLEGPDEVLAGYFAVHGPLGDRVLVLEAGALFVAAPGRLRATAFWAIAVAGAVALLFVLAVVAALRAASRERTLYGQAERGRAISQMAAMVAHEIRNPLHTIRAGAELLREQALLQHREDPAGIEMCDDILAEVQRLNALTGEFLTLARDAPLSLSEVDVGVLCDQLCAEMRRLLGPSAPRIERSGEPHIAIVADADRLRQLLRNLMHNGAQALAGAKLLRDQALLTVRVSRAGDGAEVIVGDNGPGIGEVLSHRLFEPFATTKAGGTGLGLVISRRIAEKHGGSLGLLPASKDAPGGQGARFALRLPKRPPQPGAPMKEEHGPDPVM